jgi:hypothetical protein
MGHIQTNVKKFLQIFSNYFLPLCNLSCGVKYPALNHVARHTDNFGSAEKVEFRRIAQVPRQFAQDALDFIRIFSINRRYVFWRFRENLA